MSAAAGHAPAAARPAARRRASHEHERHRDQRPGPAVPQDVGAARGHAGDPRRARGRRLLVLDEPVAMLDPVARHDFMATVLTAAADDGVSVVLSSHVLAELERVADYLILLSRGRVQVAGEVDDLLASHRVLTGPAAEAGRQAGRLNVVHAPRGGAQAHLPVPTNGTADPVPSGRDAPPGSLGGLCLAYRPTPRAA